MTELDKFKRRLVRSVSHILRKDQADQEIAWEQLRKQTNCDCKLLWERMRALTVKKLRRLLVAQDRCENIAAVARMTVTDWLIFDLVLAHEKLDVIGRDELAKGKEENSILEELYLLVVHYGIEYKPGGPKMMEAWRELVCHYNNKDRQVSVMLLQRRWFQLKELTRVNFYKLWNNYRGNQKLWDVAGNTKPTPLQSEIAKRFPQVITQPFPDWDQLIQEQKVILPEQFEQRERIPTKTSDDNPDLVMIEPEVETIDLGAESDDDSATDTGHTASRVDLSIVKQEPVMHTVKEETVEDGLSNVQILTTTHISQDMEDSNSRLSNFDIDETNREKIAEEMSNYLEAATPEPEESNEAANVAGEFRDDSPVEVETAVPSVEIPDSSDIETPETEIPDDLIKQKAERYIRSKRAKSLEETIEKTVESEEKDGTNEEVEDIFDDIIKQKADDFVKKVDMKKLVNDVLDEFKLPAGLAFADDGIEFVDDGIEYNEDEDDADKMNKKESEVSVIKIELEEETPPQEKDVKEDNAKNSEKPSIDLKLLMNPVVYTTKLDDMIVFKGKSFDFVQLQNVIDSIIIESKPVSKLPIKAELQDDEDGDDDLISQSSLSQTTEKAQNDDLFTKDVPTDVVDNQNSISLHNETTTTTPPPPPKPDSSDNDDLNDARDNSSDNESDIEIDDRLKVKSSSYLLQKPRNRSYHPIQLCKNPDFNTRLKRLTAGFFSSVRNRRLLSVCMPMTIDLSKSFEQKLINGTLYLKSSGGSPQKQNKEEQNIESTTVVPSAMPIQSLLSKENTQISTLVDLTESEANHRSKTINLRDLSEIRRINQHLLTAQVPPMRVQNSTPTENNEPPISIEIDNTETVSAQVNKPVEDPEEPKIVAVAGGLDVPVKQTPIVQEAEQPCSDVTGSSWRGRGTGRGWWRRGGRGGRGGGLPKPNYNYTIQRKCNVPWLKHKTPQPPPNLDDFLITIDTLNRMINKLDGYKESGPYKKNKPKPKLKKGPKPVELDPKPSELELKTDSNSKEEPNNSDSPVASVPEATNELTVTTEKVLEPPTRKPRRSRRVIYCCWSREKLRKLDSRSKIMASHTCHQVCECCCAQALADEMKRRVNLRLQCTETVPQSILLSDDDDANDSNDCRIPGFDPEEETPPTPKVRVYTCDKRAKPVTPIISCSHGNSTCTSVCPGRGVPISVAGVSTAQNSVTVAPAVTDNTDAEQQPVLKINVNFTPASPGDVPDFQPEITVPSINTGSDLATTSLLQHIAEQISNITVPIEPAPTVRKPLKKVVYPPAHKRSIGGNIVIDASGPSTSIGSVAVSEPTAGIASAVPTISAAGIGPAVPSGIASLAAEQKNDRVLFLNSKHISNKPAESPIYLGKNKILLTTVKFPPNLEGEPAAAPPPPAVPPLAVPPPLVIPNSSLPAGVTLVLMPSGELTYTIDSSVQLTEADLAIMPKILSAIQRQTATNNEQTLVSDSAITTTSTLQTSEILNNKNSINSKTLHETINESSQTKVPDPNDQAISVTSVVDFQEPSNSSKDSEVLIDFDQNKNSTQVSNAAESDNTDSNTLNSSKDSEIITISEADDPNTDAVTDVENKSAEMSDNKCTNSSKVVEAEASECTSSSRNLLSDLMEMSGISAEDAKPQEVAPTPLPSKPTLRVEQILNPSIQTEQALIITGSAPTNNCNISHELSPITSLAELKYACEHNGMFYKLDFDTGIIAPINVCIKKSIKTSKKRPYTYVKEPKSVIDLTDDIEVRSSEITESVLTPDRTSLLKNAMANVSKNVTADGVVKPIKLVEKVPTSRKRVKIRILDKHKVVKKLGGINYVMGTRVNRKRKQRIEAKIDLVDSDAPMEEEYLLDSSGSDNEAPTRQMVRPSVTRTTVIDSVSDSSDSSDDEPLSTKFKRLKESNKILHESSSTPESNIADNSSMNTNINESPMTANASEEIVTPVDDDEPGSKPVALVAATKPVALVASSQPVAEEALDNLDENEMDIDENLEEQVFLQSLLDDNDDAQEEDCILGV